MSSSRPNRWRSRWARAAPAVVAVALALVAPAPGAPAAAAAPPPVAVALGPTGEHVRLVVQAPDTPAAYSVSVDGVAQPVTAEPVLSDRLAVAVVVDASDAAALPAAQAGAANLVLAAPGSVRGTVVADGTPPAVVVPWPAAAPQILDGLSGLRPGGPRDTGAALDLAVAALPADTPGARLVVLHTGAPDAGGEPARVVAERMRAAGVLLAVVVTGDRGAGDRAASPFWTTVAAATGGIAVGAAPAEVLAPSEAVVSALGGRVVLTLPAPARLPATVAVRVETGAGSLVTEVVVPAAPTRPVAAGSDPPAVLVVVLVLVAAAVLVAALATAWRRRHAGRRPRRPPRRGGGSGVSRPGSTGRWTARRCWGG